jgi:hypothetical protein
LICLASTRCSASLSIMFCESKFIQAEGILLLVAFLATPETYILDNRKTRNENASEDRSHTSLLSIDDP